MKKADYQRYLQSAHWQLVRQRRLFIAQYQCEFREAKGHAKGDWFGPRCTMCDRLEVHHRHYDSLYKEKDADLEVLCRFHHLVRHASNYECPTCGDSWDVLDEDAIDAVTAAIQAEDGDIDAVTPDQVLDYLNCSYCNR